MPYTAPSIPPLDPAEYPPRPPLVVRTADLLRLLLPVRRPHDPAITAIREYVVDRGDGLPLTGHPDSETLYAELDRAIVEAVATLHPAVPNEIERSADVAIWIERIGPTITLAPELADAVCNHQDDDGHEEYRPRWVCQNLRLSMKAIR